MEPFARRNRRLAELGRTARLKKEGRTKKPHHSRDKPSSKESSRGANLWFRFLRAVPDGEESNLLRLPSEERRHVQIVRRNLVSRFPDVLLNLMNDRL